MGGSLSDQILVEGAGIPQVNGWYSRQEPCKSPCPLRCRLGQLARRVQNASDEDLKASHEERLRKEAACNSCENDHEFHNVSNCNRCKGTGNEYHDDCVCDNVGLGETAHGSRRMTAAASSALGRKTPPGLASFLSVTSSSRCGSAVLVTAPSSTPRFVSTAPVSHLGADGCMQMLRSGSMGLKCQQ